MLPTVDLLFQDTPHVVRAIGIGTPEQVLAFANQVRLGIELQSPLVF